MIPASFDYVAPTSLVEAISALAEHGDEAKLLAGGHSLLPLMRLRLATPEVIVDLGKVDELRGVRDDGDALVIGAMTPHHEVMSNALVREHCAVLADVTGQVGDAQVRHRGTLGGALAHGDAAGDLPACAAVLHAEMVAEGPGGRRTIGVDDFFVDYLETALAEGEVLVEVRIPKVTGWGHRYEKFNRVAQAWAIVGSCALVRRSNGTISEARVGLTNMGARPVRASATEAALAGASMSDHHALHDACDQASEGTDPPVDLNARPDYRQHLARVLTRRAVRAAAEA